MGSFYFIPAKGAYRQRKIQMGSTVRDYEKIIEEAKASILPYESWERLPGEMST